MTKNPDAAGMWPLNPFSWWPVILVCLAIVAFFFL